MLFLLIMNNKNNQKIEDNNYYNPSMEKIIIMSKTFKIIIMKIIKIK